MAWKDDLKPASFRGIAFFVASSESTAGRKIAIHEYPEKNLDSVEDLGRDTRRFTLECYVIGPDYNRQRDALIAAFEQAGPGDLVHPYRGRIKVSLISIARIREVTKDGGMATISAEFMETEPPSAPVEVVNTRQNILDKVNDAIDAGLAAFNAAFDIFQKPQYVLDDISKTINNATVALDTAKSNGKKALDYQREIQNIKNNTLALALSVTGIYEAFENLFTLDDTLAGVFENLKLKDFGRGELITEPNNNALNKSIRELAVIGSAKAITGVDYNNTAQAAEIRDALGVALDQLMNEAIDDVLYNTLYELRGAVLLDIEQRSIDIPVILNIVLPDSLPSLFLAYDRYEDVDRAPEIVSRNNVMHPGFLPGGVDLEVLSRE